MPFVHFFKINRVARVVILILLFQLSKKMQT